MTVIATDRPIGDPKDDEFGRDLFAQALANALVLPVGAPSIVAGIEAEWGTGKTSVLNLVAHHLKRHQPEPIVVRLEGWLLSAGEGTLLRFLGQLAVALGGKDKGPGANKAAKKLKLFSDLLAPISLVPGIGKLVHDGVEGVAKGGQAIAHLINGDVEGKKKAVVEALRAADRPIVVILDDLDRLEPSEIRQAFRFVKAVADFERVAYLLAYDPDPVQRALSFDGVYDGQGFLEKIVQLAYPLPRPDYWAIKKYLHSRLAPFLDGANLEDHERRRLDDLYSAGGLAHSIRHPRDANRLANRVSISLRATRREVNAADVIAFETIAMRFPQVAIAIARRPHDFLGRFPDHQDPSRVDYFDQYHETKDKVVPQWRKALWEDLPREEGRSLRLLIEFIFPGFSGVPFGSIANHEAESQLLIRSPWPLLKLLSVGSISSGYSAGTVVDLLTKPEKRPAAIGELYAKDARPGGLFYASSFISQYPVVDARSLIATLTECALAVSLSVDSEDSKSIPELTFFAEGILRSLGEGANEIFLSIANDPRSLSFSHGLVLEAARGHGLWPEDLQGRQQVIEDKAVVELGIKLWLDRVRERSQEPSRLMNEALAIEILYRWGQFSSFDEVHDYFDRLTSTDDGIDSFLSIWPVHRWGHESFGKLVGDWRRFRDRLERHRNRASLRPEPWELFKLLEQAEQALPPEVTPSPGDE